MNTYAEKCRFAHIYERNSQQKTLIFVLVQSNYTKVVVSKDFNCWRILHQDIVVLIRKCMLVLLHFDPLPFLFLCVQSEGKAPPFNYDVHFWLGKATSQVKWNIQYFSIKVEFGQNSYLPSFLKRETSVMYCVPLKD